MVDNLLSGSSSNSAGTAPVNSNFTHSITSSFTLIPAKRFVFQGERSVWICGGRSSLIESKILVNPCVALVQVANADTFVRIYFDSRRV